MEGGPFCPPPHPWAAPKKPILNRVKSYLFSKIMISLLVFRTNESLSFQMIYYSQVETKVYRSYMAGVPHAMTSSLIWKNVTNADSQAKVISIN